MSKQNRYLKYRYGRKGLFRFSNISSAKVAYDYTLKCSHTFNLLDARGAINVTERTGFIGRVRNLARLCAEIYVRQREAMEFPLLKDEP